MVRGQTGAEYSLPRQTFFKSSVHTSFRVSSNSPCPFPHPLTHAEISRGQVSKFPNSFYYSYMSSVPRGIQIIHHHIRAEFQSKQSRRGKKKKCQKAKTTKKRHLYASHAPDNPTHLPSTYKPRKRYQPWKKRHPRRLTTATASSWSPSAPQCSYSSSASSPSPSSPRCSAARATAGGAGAAAWRARRPAS